VKLEPHRVVPEGVTGQPRPRTWTCSSTNVSYTRICSRGAADTPTRPAKRVAAYHTWSSAVGKVASRAGARLLVLNHFVPVPFDRDALLGEVTADFAGPVVIGEDLLTIDVAVSTPCA
jgi:hypothetical protein